MSDSERLRGVAPSLLNAALARLLLTLGVAATFWALAVWREMHASTSVDPAAMALRLVAVGATLRLLLGLGALIARIRLGSSAKRQQLTFDDDMLHWERTRDARVISRESVWAITRLDDGAVVLVVSPENGDPLVVFPPIFDATPALFETRLRRWWGGPSRHLVEASPVRSASKAYDEAAAGKIPEGTSVVRHGRGWLRRGPYLAVLFSLVFLDGSLRLPTGVGMGLLPIVGLVACLTVPLIWLWSSLRDISPRRGVAMVVTPAEVIMRTRAGVLRATWKRVERIRIEGRPNWTVLEGLRPLRKLTIDRTGDTPIRYDEAYLGVPAEVAVALLTAYRDRTRPPATAEEE